MIGYSPSIIGACNHLHRTTKKLIVPTKKSCQKFITETLRTLLKIIIIFYLNNFDHISINSGDNVWCENFKNVPTESIENI